MHRTLITLGILGAISCAAPAVRPTLDLNKDGHKDRVDFTANFDGTHLEVRLGTWYGHSVQHLLELPYDPVLEYALALVDVDGDQDLDIALTRTAPRSPLDGRFVMKTQPYWIWENEDGRFKASDAFYPNSLDRYTGLPISEKRV